MITKQQRASTLLIPLGRGKWWLVWGIYFWVVGLLLLGSASLSTLAILFDLNDDLRLSPLAVIFLTVLALAPITLLESFWGAKPTK